MRLFRTVVALLVLWLPASSGVSAMVAGLNEAEVPVAAQDNAARSAAAAAALAEVFVKTSGSRNVLANPVVSDAIRHADRLMAQFYYTRITRPANSDDARGEEMGLHAVFPAAAIANLLRRAGEPLLPSHRPATLLWIAIDDAAGAGPRLFDRDSDRVLGDWLRVHAARRGIPLRLPEMDLQDSSTVDVAEVWRLDVPALQAASERYGPGPLMLVKLAATGEDGWVAEWVYADGEQQGEGRSAATGIDALAGAIADFAAEGVAARYAVHADGEQGEELRLRVDGLRDFPAYYRTYTALREMVSVRKVQLALVDRDSFFFDLSTVSDAQAVLRELSLLRELQPVGEAEALHYRWFGG